MLNKLFFTCSFLFVLQTILPAQLIVPAASPSATVRQAVGLTDVEVTYSRPSTKGRKIFGNAGLVPYDEMWRTGANDATKLTVSDEVVVIGTKLPKGSYAILTKPSSNDWTVYIYPFEKKSWSSYLDSKPILVLFPIVEQSQERVESFRISFEELKIDRMQMVLAWENTKLTFPIRVEDHDQVMANINQAMEGPSEFDYFFAATYLHESGKNIDKALEYIQKATKSEKPRFFFFRREALILADMNRKKDAILAARRSSELALSAGNQDFLRLNELSIKEWEQ